jgi:hypothetical protein
MQVAQVTPGVYQSKWGFHPCSVETCRLLKRLNHHRYKAWVAFRHWQRWDRKLPHNRVERRWIRDEKGQKIGSEIVGPRRAPKLCPMFTTLDWAGRVKFCDNSIEDDYKNARTPRSSPSEVRPTALRVDEILKMLEELEGPAEKEMPSWQQGKE